MTLTDFLLARITEDEAAFRKSWSRGVLDPDASELERLLVPARMQAECEAKRRIITGASLEIGLSTAEDWLFPLLALPYADHSDYNAAWRPAE
jgi:hypothetical protein